MFKKKRLLNTVTVFCGLGFILLLVASCLKEPKTIRVAAILPITGPNAAIGIGMMNSIQLAIDQANRTGIFGNTKVSLLKLDDASNPEQGVSAATKACSDKYVVAVTAHWNTGVALATNEVFHRYRLANLLPGTVGYQVTMGKHYDEIFRIVPHDLAQAQHAVMFSKDILRAKSVFLIDDNTSFGKSQTTLFNNFSKENGLLVIGKESIAVGEKDFHAVLTKVKLKTPDLLFVGCVVTEAALIRTQMVRLGIKAKFLGGPALLSSAFCNIVGKAGDGAFDSNVLLPMQKLPGGKQFVNDYNKARFDKPYESQGIFAYAAAQILIECIRRVGPNRASIINELKTGTFNTALGQVSFDKFGDTTLRAFPFYELINGEWTLVYTTDPHGNFIKEN